MIAVGQPLPAGEFSFITPEGKQLRDSHMLFAGKKVVLFALGGDKGKFARRQGLSYSNHEFSS